MHLKIKMTRKTFQQNTLKKKNPNLITIIEKQPQ